MLRRVVARPGAVLGWSLICASIGACDLAVPLTASDGGSDRPAMTTATTPDDDASGEGGRPAVSVAPPDGAGGGGGDTGPLGPPMAPRVALDCSNGVDGLSLNTIPTVYAFYMGRVPNFNLSGITAGSADLPISVNLGNVLADEVTAVAVNGRTVTWGAPVTWGAQISGLDAIIPAAELVTAGPLRIQVIADGGCRYADISVVDDGPGRPEIQVDPTDLPLASDRNIVSVSGTDLGVPDAGLATVTPHLVLWRDIAHAWESPWAPLLTGTSGDAWIYQVNTQEDRSRRTSVFAVASNWVRARVVGIDPIPDIVAANPAVLPLGPDTGSSVTVTLTARERFSSFTQIRAGHDATDQRLLGECGEFAATCRVAVPASLLSRAGPLTFAASTPGVASGSPLAVPVEAPMP